tara:strand:+ start:378 stop:617 length:240 start_codon:yes stop_codon:yes gene_type:complete
MKISFKGRKHSEETTRKLSEIYKCRKFSEEHRRNMGESLKGKNNPMYGKYHLEEWKRKISKAMKDRKKLRIFGVDEHGT